VTKNTPAVVSLLGDTKRAAGSGVVVSADGIILTAAHVTQGNSTMTVIFPDKTEKHAKVLGANATRDVGLVKIIEAGPFPFAEIGDSDTLEPTTMVVALGHPGGFDARRTPPVRIGRISMKNLGGFLVSDCTLIGGDSGGPLFALDGKVVGIHSSISEALDFNRSAPVNAAKADWQRLLDGEKWGKLGGKLGDFLQAGEKPVIGASLDPKSENGVKLTEVLPQSPAAIAGIRAGDVVVKIGGEETKTAEDLTAKLGRKKPGDSVDLTFRRADAELKATLQLVSQSEMLKRIGVEKSK
jgi:serine protease Do